MPTAPALIAWTTPCPATSLDGLLDDDDRSHLATLREQAARDRSATGRALLRLLLARHLGAPPADVLITRACPDCPRPHGQPRTAGLHLSSASTGGRVLVGLSASPVGVDVERRDAADFPGFDGIALTDAEQRSAAGRAELWAGKEALLKRDGVGLRRDPRSVETAGAELQALDLGPDYVAVVATDRPVHVIDATGLVRAWAASSRRARA
ncbi:4'-phosphopantetheinyl transferase superfamily protein [Jatrophihabitans sp.]|uniref:4'-phosphopantetheinyl transferase family protein n=1 Tax=Jatrophihabitans sp. TaxID=1932789 RepID=UPI0030C6C6EF|nr:4-phosphopantetheinyl transferase superfamily protein [Jatrophihabitans sp.]